MVADRATLIKRLSMVNYYRLSAYWHPFRISNDPNDRLIAGTTLDVVWEHYVFDRQLRLIIIDAIERAEVAVRAQLVNLHALEYGPFGYLLKSTLPGITIDNHQRLLDRLHTEEKNSRETYVAHYRSKYDNEIALPLWIACELMTFGNLFTLFTGLKTKHKKTLAKRYGLNVPVFGSWLKTLNQVRNLCAHHARIWNRVYGIQAIIPSRQPNNIWTAPDNWIESPVWNDLP